MGKVVEAVLSGHMLKGRVLICLDCKNYFVVIHHLADKDVVHLYQNNGKIEGFKGPMLSTYIACSS